MTTDEVLKDIGDILTKVQTATPKETSKFLSTLSEMLNEEDTGFIMFRPAVMVILADQKAEIPKKLFQFVQTLIAMTSKKFNQEFYDFLISVIDCKNRKIRIKVLSLLDLFDIKDCDIGKICEKLFDKDKTVRKMAVKVASRYQDVTLNEKTKLIGIFKDLVRYDTSPDVRKEVLKYMDSNINSYGCLLTRAEDESVAVRRFFYTEVLKTIPLKSIENDKKVFLMKKSFSEREIDAKSIFVNKCRTEYQPEEIETLCFDFFDNECVGELLRYYFPTAKVQFNLEKIDVPSSYLLYEYLKYVEDFMGRDSLDLVPINEFLQHLYRVCTESIENHSLIPIVKNLFKILKFYELYDTEVLKIVQGTVYKLLGKNFIPEVIDECLSIPNINNNITFIGSLIYKNMNDLKVLLLCRSVMKCVPLNEMHDAIINELLPLHNDINIKYEIFFYYCLQECRIDFLNILLDNISETYHMLTDLYLSVPFSTSLLIKEKLFKFINQNFNESTAMAASKIMLRDKSDVFIEKSVKLYYSTENNKAKQFLTVLFFELFRNNPYILINNFCSILNLLPSNYKTWVDQSLFWLENADSNVHTEFIYKVCVFLSKNILHQKLLLPILDRLKISNDICLIKKIIYCCGLLAKKGFEVGNILGRLMAIDDGVPIDTISIDIVKGDCGLM